MVSTRPRATAPVPCRRVRPRVRTECARVVARIRIQAAKHDRTARIITLHRPSAPDKPAVDSGFMLRPFGRSNPGLRCVPYRRRPGRPTSRAGRRSPQRGIAQAGRGHRPGPGGDPVRCRLGGAGDGDGDGHRSRPHWEKARSTRTPHVFAGCGRSRFKGRPCPRGIGEETQGRVSHAATALAVSPARRRLRSTRRSCRSPAAAHLRGPQAAGSIEPAMTDAGAAGTAQAPASLPSRFDGNNSR